MAYYLCEVLPDQAAAARQAVAAAGGGGVYGPARPGLMLTTVPLHEVGSFDGASAERLDAADAASRIEPGDVFFGSMAGGEALGE